MSLEITANARDAAAKINVEPQIVLKIEGVDTVFGARIVKKRIRIGDADLVIGNDWVIGGFNEVEDQSPLITLSGGTTTSIKQQLNADKGASSYITSMQISLIDKNLEATELISPGVVVEDILGRKARVYLGFEGGTGFPEDYIVIFRGIIDDVSAGQGVVSLNIAHPDQKKRQQIFTIPDISLSGAINDAVTALTLSSLTEVFGPSFAAQDDGFNLYFKIDDEWLKYYNTVGPNCNVLRGELSTAAAAHSDGAGVTCMYRITGNIIDIALKLMLSSAGNLPYVEDISVTSSTFINIDESEPESIFFEGIDLFEEYGVQAGDTATIEYIDHAANFSLVIQEVVIRDDGTLLIFPEGSGLYDEPASNATMSLTSQYNVYPAGLGMAPNEVDIDEHLRMKRLFLSNVNMDFYIQDEINGKEFIEMELYKPVGAFSVPRKSKASIGYHIGPIPGTQTVVLNESNVINPDRLKVRRSINQNFSNTITYAYDPDDLGDGEFQRGVIERDATSTSRIPVGTKSTHIESKGLRQADGGQNIVESAAERRLNRYKFGAEYIEALETNLKTGFTLEIGDIVLLNGANLNVLNSSSGNRTPVPKLYEVTSKQLNLLNGRIVLGLIDTSYSTQSRYGLISPSSKVRAGISESSFTLKESYYSPYGDKEYLKWTKLVSAEYPLAIKVKSADGTTRFAQALIDSIVGNTVTLDRNLGFTPQADDIMELANFSFADNEQAKLLYAFMNDSDFPDGSDQYLML
jgi:hypothetical protein